MKKLLQLSLIALFSVSASAAFAAAPAPSWTGCYIGANAGYAGAYHSYTDPLAAPPDADLGNHNAAGFLGGGQAGCDYQYANWIFGLQGMASSFNASTQHLALGDFYASKNAWLTTATARVGVTVTPNLIVFVRGGAAWMRDHETKVDLITGLLEGTNDSTRTGWTAGAGGEYLITPMWSVFLQYDFMNFGTFRTPYITPDVPPVVFPLDITQSVHSVRAGVNLRFNPMNIGK
jgi:outer membrane immunogenic protein